jgi:hypothetical protein
VCIANNVSFSPHFLICRYRSARWNSIPHCAADLKRVAVTAGADRAQLAFADQLKVTRSDGEAAFWRCCRLRNADAANECNA